LVCSKYILLCSGLFVFASESKPLVLRQVRAYLSTFLFSTIILTDVYYRVFKIARFGSILDVEKFNLLYLRNLIFVLSSHVHFDPRELSFISTSEMAIEFWRVCNIEVIYLLVYCIPNTDLPHCIPCPIERSCLQKLSLFDCQIIGCWVHKNESLIDRRQPFFFRCYIQVDLFRPSEMPSCGDVTALSFENYLL